MSVHRGAVPSFSSSSCFPWLAPPLSWGLHWSGFASKYTSATNLATCPFNYMSHCASVSSVHDLYSSLCDLFLPIHRLSLHYAQSSMQAESMSTFIQCLLPNTCLINMQWMNAQILSKCVQHVSSQNEKTFRKEK